MTICAECGHHTFFAYDRCPCGAEIHVKGCSKLPGVCKCHDENKKVWEKKHPPEIKKSKNESNKGNSTKTV